MCPLCLCEQQQDIWTVMGTRNLSKIFPYLTCPFLKFLLTAPTACSKLKAKACCPFQVAVTF